MKTLTARKMKDLLGIVAGDCDSPSFDAEETLQVTTAFGHPKQILARNAYKGPKFYRPDASTEFDNFVDSREPLIPLIKGLLELGKPFVISTGMGDARRVFEWGPFNE